jgi:hypothetical protein
VTRTPKSEQRRRALTAFSSGLRLLSVLVVAWGAAGLGGAALSAAATPLQRAVVSRNWAGYAVSAAGATFSDVRAAWVVPEVDCAGNIPTSSSIWIGLGGFAPGSAGLEQIGTSSDCHGQGRPSYEAWYELIPQGPVRISLPVAPGDAMSAEVSSAETTVSLQMTVSLQIRDATEGTDYAVQVRVQSPDFSSAEWIVEAPSLCSLVRKTRCSPMRLADFGVAAFSDAAATVNGHTGTISDPIWTATQVILAGAPRAPSAVPSSFSADGSSFSITWRASPANRPLPANARGL